jgi:transposase
LIAAGGARPDAAEIDEVGLQTVREWVLAFNAEGLDELIDSEAAGARPRLNAEQHDVLKALVEQEPMPAAHGLVRRRLCDLAQIPSEDHDVAVSEQTLSLVLRAMGYRKLSARLRHPDEDSGTAAVFRKASPTFCGRSGRLSGLSPWRSGSATRPVSARRTRSPDAGPNGERDLPPQRISARSRHTF